ncbi:hypothetical protein ACPWUF_08950 [Bisgaard Taxon 46]
MFSWKKVLFGSLAMMLSLVVLSIAGMFFLTLEPKDNCLDDGGRYNEVTQTCEK